MAHLRIQGEFPSSVALKAIGDGDLVRLLAQGHGEAMTVVFDRYYTPMMRLALRILRNRAEAEDVVQVSFTDFYRQVKLFDESKGNLRGWLLQYVYGRCMNRLKTLKIRHHADHVELSDVPPAELASPQEDILDLNEPEAKRLVQQVLGKLNDKKRRIVEMICLDGMTLREVAALTEEPQTRVHNQYYRALAELRATIREFGKPTGLAPKLAPTAEKQGDLKVGRKELEIG